MNSICKIPVSRLWLILLLFLNYNTSFSQSWLKDLGNSVGDVLETGWKATTAPVESIINTGDVIVNQGDPSKIYQPYKELSQKAGTTVQGTGSFVANTQNYMYQKAKDFASEIGGDEGEFIFDISTFSTKYYNDLANSGTQAIANVLKGQNPLHVTAAPLAAALRAARESHYNNSKPIPEDVKRALAPYFNSSILNRARYAVGTVQITLPNFIGQGNAFMGNDYAVVVDDIIVFNSNPPSFSESSFWWVHEMQHVEQYEKWGVERFAFNYIRDLGSSIERDADNKARRVTNNSHSSNMGAAYLKTDIGLSTHRNARSIPNEYFVLQCFFPQDRYPVNYLVTNTGKIIAVDLYTGNWIHIGYATPPLANGVAWTYQTQHIKYAVTPNGGIMTEEPMYDPWGRFMGNRFVQIGHVERL